MNESDYMQYTLPNGIRVIHHQVKGAPVSHCGIMINAGSREEEEQEHGLAHFIEHAIFKGTRRRKAFHILSRLDAVGGELNAFTSKEETFIYGAFLTGHFERALDLMTDITFHSVFPEKEVEKEKEVIIDEIQSYLDTPSEQIFDDFESQLFAGHPVGRSILGTEKHLKNFNKSNILRFIGNHYTTDQIVFTSVGDISENRLKKLANKYLGDVPASKSSRKRESFRMYRPSEKTVKRAGFQSHCMIGNVAYGVSDKNRRSLILLNNMLGGPAMNSRLNLNIREKFGFTYNIESNYTPYSDTGIFAIYLGTDSKTMDKTIHLALKELKKLRDKKLGTLQLHLARQQLNGHIALARESKSSMMTYMAKNLLLFDQVESIEQTYKRIEGITAEQLLEVANEIFDESQLSRLTYLPG